MKKITMLVAAFAAMCSSSAFAQNVNLPAAGTISTEVQFNPFGQDNNHFSIEGLKVRYFLTDVDAVRLTLGLNMSSNNNTPTVTSAPEGASTYDVNLVNYKKDNDEDKTNSGTFSLDLGYERHLLKSGRLDLYAGAQLGIEFAWSKTTSIVGMGDGVDKFWTQETETKNKTAYFAFGANVFTGIDFYLYKGLYVGTELGLSFNNKSYKDIETTFTDNDPNASTHSVSSTEYNKKGNTDLGFYVEPSLRLGWTF